MFRALSFAVLLAGCDDTVFNNAGGGTTGELSEGYAGVIQIFEADCVSCHPAGGGSGGLDLESDPCASLVDVPAQGYSNATLVIAGDSAGSVLWNKMADSGTYGGVMPLGGALDATLVDHIAAWIDDGADCTL